MRNRDNYNDNNDPWQTLSAATERLLNRKQKQGADAGDDRKRDDGDKKDEEAQRNYVDHRLRELAAFEARARGIRKRP